MLFTLSSVLAFASVSLVVGSSHEHRSRHHPSRAPGNTTLAKRFSGTATYYLVGLGACGKRNEPQDYIVALNSAQYGGGYPGPNCFRQITISAGGKSANAEIRDECPTCGYGDLDLSQGLFEHFYDTGKGVFEMNWDFNDGSSKNDDDDKPKEEEKKTTTSKKHTTTSTRHTTTTTSTRRTTTTTSTTSSAETTSEASSSSAALDSSSSASGTPTETGSATASASAIPGAGGSTTDTTSKGGNIGAQQRLVANLGAIASYGKSS